MRVKISSIKINPGRREAEPKAIEELARSIAAVGLLNPITLDQNNTLVAGLHRLEAAKLLGWTEIECTAIGMNTVQAELAEIDENIVRTRLNRQELCEQLLRRKEIYEMLHPETKAGAAQAAGMNRAIGNNVSAKLAPTSKSFVEDTSEKTGMSKRAVSRLLQIANNLTGDARRIVEANNMTQDTALKLSRLQHDEQVEAASMLAAGELERRGIATEKGNINREIAADNKLLKEIKARITRLYNWSKEQAETAAPVQGKESIVAKLWQARMDMAAPSTRTGKIKKLQEDAKLFSLLQSNGITSMQQLYEKVSAMNKDYYDLRGQIVKAERRIAVLDERLKMWEQYQQYKPIRQKLDKMKPGKREKYQQEHESELSAFDAAADFLKGLKESGEKITPKAWRAEAAKLTMQKDADYQKMREMREDIKAVENLRKTADRLAREGQHQQKEQER